MASPSPPLFPVPQKTAIEVWEGKNALILLTQQFAARSIKLIDKTGSFSIVYLSKNRICSTLGIFIYVSVLIWFLLKKGLFSQP
jgi:hypothetical protein